MAISDYITGTVTFKIDALPPRRWFKPFLSAPEYTHPAGRTVRLLYLLGVGDDWEIQTQGAQVRARRVLVWPKATPAEMTQECREIGVSAALSWLASHMERDRWLG